MRPAETDLAVAHRSTMTFENYLQLLTDLADNCIVVYLPRSGGPSRVTVP